VKQGFVPHRNIFDPLWGKKWLRDIVKSGYAVIVVEHPGAVGTFYAWLQKLLDSNMAIHVDQG